MQCGGISTFCHQGLGMEVLAHFGPRKSGKKNSRSF